MSVISSKSTRHTERQENTTHSDENRPGRGIRMKREGKMIATVTAMVTLVHMSKC